MAKEVFIKDPKYTKDVLTPPAGQPDSTHPIAPRRIRASSGVERTPMPKDRGKRAV